MSKQANPMAIGGFVLGALILAVVAILVFSSDALFKSKIPMVSYFPGTVQGLDVGARVEFRGVQIGQVVGIKLDYWKDEGRFAVPVQYEIWPESLNIFGGKAAIEGGKNEYDRLVREEGLRAQLEAVSLVTGQYMISLDLYPNTPANLVSEDPTVVEIPAIESTRDRVAGMLEGLRLNELVNQGIEVMQAITALVEDPAVRALVADADQVLRQTLKMVADLDAGIEPILRRLDGTLVEYSSLAQTLAKRVNTLADSIEKTSAEVGLLSRNIDSKIGPMAESAQRSLDKAGKAFDAANDLLAEDSAPRHNLDLLLEEAAGAARSLRLLADYIEQNPDALIKGKY